MSDDLVVMHNDIVTSAYNLSVNEQRLIYCALSKMPKREPIDPKTPFYISREDFIELGANPDNVARDIRQATKDLMKKTLYVNTDTGILEFHWLSEVLRYDKNAEQKLRDKYPDPKDHKEYMNSLRLYNLLDACLTASGSSTVCRLSSVRLGSALGVLIVRKLWAMLPAILPIVLSFAVLKIA
jgi:hypothetical protein